MYQIFLLKLLDQLHQEGLPGFQPPRQKPDDVFDPRLLNGRHAGAVHPLLDVDLVPPHHTSPGPDQLRFRPPTCRHFPLERVQLFLSSDDDLDQSFPELLSFCFV